MIIMYVMPSLVLMRHDMNEALQHISTCSICACIHIDQTVHNIQEKSVLLDYDFPFHQQAKF